MSVWMFMIRPVAVTMTMHRADVERTALGVERRLDFRDAAPQALDHVDDHVIVADTQAISPKLCREMAVAQMPGNANERADIRCGDLAEWLGRRLPPSNASAAQDEAGAIAEHDGLRRARDGRAAGRDRVGPD